MAPAQEYYRINAQSEPMASCSFPTTPLQGPQSVCIYWHKYTKPMAPAEGSWKLCTVGLQFQCFYKYNCSTIITGSLSVP